MPALPEEWLRSPDTQKALRWNAAASAFEDGDHQYAVQDGVAFLLPEDQKLLVETSEQHRSQQSDFRYADHYQKDAEIFDYFAGWEDEAATHENRRLREMIIAQVPAKTERILDVGCGSAWVAEHFGPKGVAVVSMDISTVNPTKAVERYPYPSHYGVVADALHLPFREAIFDVIVASEIIEHVPDPALFLRSLLPALRPGGQLIVTTPYNERIAYSLCVHCNRMTPHHAHLHSFTQASIVDCLPSPLKGQARTTTFINKALLRLRTHVVLKYLPFNWWRLIDRLFNGVIRKPARLMMVVKRPSEKH